MIDLIPALMHYFRRLSKNGEEIMDANQLLGTASLSLTQSGLRVHFSGGALSRAPYWPTQIYRVVFLLLIQRSHVLPAKGWPGGKATRFVTNKLKQPIEK